ncbi:LuxR family transcriptional regulator [Actinomadura sp. GC306]|uniref:helix-turn-helix transcriptional regulator n=1 Tax=Actinomadura sp. GC306 TaxID=2530367 RepID=UPI001404342D|nr:LuxR family transcriptional regulator [Actinomadura sp. GC306]
MLYGRAAETAEVERLVAGARAGSGGAAVVRGEAGIGKTALLRHAADAAEGALLLDCAGCPSEADQPYASLELMLRPVRDRVDALPAAAAQRLRALGGPPPGGPAGVLRSENFEVGRALLALLRLLGTGRTVVCLVDDAQWLDAASADALAFAARRFGGEPVALLAAVRGERVFRTWGLTEIRPRRLAPDDAAALLHDAAADLAPPARERVLAEAEGNPLALRLLPASLSPAQRAGRINPVTFHDGTSPLSGTFQAEAAARLDALPAATRLILLATAADGAGASARAPAAAGRLGATVADLAPAERTGLVETSGTTIRFAHPLVRAAVYHRATTAERRAVHQALADHTDEGLGTEDAERRAWHLAAAAAGPSERVAAELERAGRLSGAARAYACHARAAELTPGGAARAERLAAAARTAVEAGLFAGAAEAAGAAARLPAGPLTRAALARAGAAAELECGSPRRACRMLLDGALPLGGRAPADAMLLLAEAVQCGRGAGDARLVREALDAMAAVPVAADSPLAALPQALSAATGGTGEALVTLIGVAGLPGEAAHRLTAVAAALADDARETAAGLVRDCRESGLPGRLPAALQTLAHAEIGRGRHREAREAAVEGLRLAGDGARYRAGHLRCLLGWLAAVEGDAERCAALVAAGTEHASREGIAPTVALGTWALAVLHLGHGRNEEALARLEDLPEDVLRAGGATDAVRQASDRVEAAVRCGTPERAESSLSRLERWADGNQSAFTTAILKRCRALLHSGGMAERDFAEAAVLHGRCGNDYERARTELLYGEWLRRERRRARAREHLSRAMELFERQGARVWALRARAELGAAGVRPAGAPPPGPDGIGGLTHQELQIVRLAASGASNREIAARLYLSPRTVGNHLYRAFPKLGVRTRVELRGLDLGITAREGSGPRPME